MRRYYCVITTIRDDGKVLANTLPTQLCDKKPENDVYHGRYKDIFFDYFDDYETAKAFLDDVKRA